MGQKLKHVQFTIRKKGEKLQIYYKMFNHLTLVAV